MTDAAPARLTPFAIDVPQGVLDDLATRLAATRWPTAPDDAAWQYGANTDYMKKLVAYWRTEFDWRRTEAGLNQWPHFRARIDDFDIHVIVLRAAGAARSPRPLLITHGWPSSCVEMLDILAPLADPARFGGDPDDAFDVICPTLPGFPLSSAPPRPIGPRAIAGLWHRLMTEVLGHDRYFAHGGDWGSVVSAWLALDHPDAVRGIHLTMAPLAPNPADGAPFDNEERAWRVRTQKRLKREDAYQRIQRTKPQTLAFGLNDSPVGLAAWLVEKFQGAPNATAETVPPFPMDRLLTNIMLYWTTSSINSANWIYRAAPDEGALIMPAGQKIDVPCVFSLPPRDLFPRPPPQWIARGYTCVKRNDLDSGGHFLAMEIPDTLVSEIRAFGRTVVD